MENNDGSLLRSIVLREVMQERGSVEQRRRRFARSIAKAKKKEQKQRASNKVTTKDLDKRSSAMRAVFEATRSMPTTKQNTSEEESRLHVKELFTRNVSKKEEVQVEQAMSLIFKNDLQKSTPQKKKLDIFERKRRIRDGNAVWSLLERIKERARISHKALSLRLNSPLKEKHRAVLSQLSLAHHGSDRLRTDFK